MGDYTPQQVAKWTFESSYRAIAEMKRRSEEIRNATRTSSVDFDSTDSDWKGSVADAARDLSRQHYEDARTTANVIEDIADQAGELFDQLKPEAKIIREALEEVKNSEYLLKCDSKGNVFSTRSIPKWIEKWGASAVYKIPMKESKEDELTDKIKKALDQIEQIDKAGFEKLNSNMEDLSPAVKEGANKLPSDSELAGIMRKYQAKASKKTSLFPPEQLRNILKKLGKDIKPQMMTQEEIAMLMSLNKGNNLKFAKDLWDFHKIKEQAEAEARKQFPQDLDPNDEKNLVDSGYADAFRHSYWNSLLTQRFGADWAKKFTTAHEGLGGNSPAREAMDLYNNEVGRKIAQDNPDATPQQMAAKVRASITNGDNLVIGHDNQIAKTTADGAANADGKGTGVPRTTGIPLPAN